MEFASPPPTRKPGRPPTKNTGKARSNSAGAKPDVASSPLKTPPPKTDDLRDDQATPPPETANPTPTSPPPEDTPTSPKVDPEDEAKKKFIKRFQILLEDCQDLIDIYNKLQLNAVLVKQLVAESNVLLERITECLDLINNHSDLEDLFSEANRWKRIIKTFVVSMLG